MTRHLALPLALALLALPGVARAAPATVAVFEAEVHAAPDRSSPVLDTLPEDARVSASEAVTNGFRKVRLPDGKVGWIEEGALALGAPEARPPGQAPGQPPAQPPGPPPSRTPPPPPYAAPPPPYAAPPPYGAPPPPYGYPGYRRAAYVDPNAFRHLGLYLRLDLGLGYLGSSTSSSGTLFTFDRSRGFAGDIAFALGGAIQENFILAGQFWATSAADPSLTQHGATVPNGGTLSNALYGVGPCFTWYLMPANVFLSVTPSLTWLEFGDYYGSYQTDVGFATRVALGKQWWVGPHWGIGVTGWFVGGFNREGGGADATWRSFAGGLAFSAALN